MDYVNCYWNYNLGLKELPYIGSVVSFVITILGLGILVTALLPKKKTSNKKKLKNQNQLIKLKINKFT